MDIGREGAPQETFAELKKKISILLERFSNERKKYTDVELSELKKETATLAGDIDLALQYGETPEAYIGELGSLLHICDERLSVPPQALLRVMGRHVRKIEKIIFDDSENIDTILDNLPFFESLAIHGTASQRKSGLTTLDRVWKKSGTLLLEQGYETGCADALQPIVRFGTEQQKENIKKILFDAIWALQDTIGEQKSKRLLSELYMSANPSVRHFLADFHRDSASAYGVSIKPFDIQKDQLIPKITIDALANKVSAIQELEQHAKGITRTLHTAYGIEDFTMYPPVILDHQFQYLSAKEKPDAAQNKIPVILKTRETIGAIILSIEKGKRGEKDSRENRAEFRRMIMDTLKEIQVSLNSSSLKEQEIAVYLLNHLYTIAKCDPKMKRRIEEDLFAAIAQNFDPIHAVIKATDSKESKEIGLHLLRPLIYGKDEDLKKKSIDAILEQKQLLLTLLNHEFFSQTAVPFILDIYIHGKAEQRDVMGSIYKEIIEGDAFDPQSFHKLAALIEDKDQFTSGSGVSIAKQVITNWGLPADPMLRAWRRSRKKIRKDLMEYEQYGVGVNMAAVHELEKKKQGDAALLHHEFGITYFARYPQEMMIQQAREIETHLPYGMIIAAGTDDHRGVDYEARESIYKNLFGQLNVDKENHIGVRVLECETTHDLVRALQKLDSKYGKHFKPSFVIIKMHGNEDSMQLGQRNLSGDITSKKLTHKKTRSADLESFIDPKCNMIISSCMSGVRLAKDFSELLGIEVTAPLNATFVEKITVLFDLDKTLRLKAEYGHGNKQVTYKNGELISV